MIPRLTARTLQVGLACTLLLMTGAACSTRSPDVGGTRNGLSHLTALTVGVVPAPPVTDIDPNTRRPSGYMIDVVDAIVLRSGLKVTYVRADWATMGAALDSRKIDVIAGPIFMTEGRALTYDFSAPVFAYAVVPLVPRGSGTIRHFDDLKKPGLRVAVGRGGFDAEFVSRSMPQAKVTVFPPDDPTLSALEVVAGRADLALLDYNTAARFVHGHPETEIRLVDTPASIQFAGFMFRQGDSDLRDFWNVAMRNLDLAGELQKLDDKYGASGAWYGRVSQRPELIRPN